MSLPNTDVVVAIVWLTLATVATRAGLLVAGQAVRFPRAVEAALRYAPACALAALVVPEVLAPTGVVDVGWTNPRWPATIVAGLFLLWRHSIVGCIAGGMCAYAVIQWAS
jgi:branched-subunit amino acid transport protein